MDLRSMDNEERLAGQFRRVRCASAFDEEGKYRLLWKSKGEKLIWYISFTGHFLSVVFEAAQPCFASCRLVMPFFSLRQEGARLYIDVDWHRPAEDFLLLVRELVAVTDQIEDVDEALSLVVARLREGMARVCPSEDGGHLPSRVREERFSYANKVVEEAGDRMKHIRYSDFIKRMDLAYAAADAVVSRSGASSVSELAAEHKAVIFVPSPNVAENHQTHNAMALVRKNAAMIVPDAEAPQRLMEEACGLLGDKEKIAGFEKNIATFARPDAAKKIVEEIYRLV